MAGASGAETSAAQLQAAARGGSGLTKGEPYLKSYGYMAGTVATFRSRGPQPPAAEARKTNRSRDGCVPRRLRPLAHRIFDRRIKKHFRRFTLYRSTDRGCKPGNVRFSVPTGVGSGESHSRRLFCLLFWSRNRRSSREPSGLASPSSSPFGSAKPACTALTGSVGCTNGRGARRNRAAYRGQRPFADYGEVARGSRRQTVGKKVSAPPA